MGIGEFLIIVVVAALIGGGIYLYRKQLAKKAPATSSKTTITAKFCPKCGNALAEGASACSKCGNKIKSTGTGSVASEVMNSSQLPKVGIAAIVCAVLTVIFSFLPWFQAESAASYTKGVSSFFGGMGSSLVFESSYSAWTASGLAETLSSYYSLMSNKAATGNLAILGPLSLVALIAAVALIALGSFMAFKYRKMLALRIGALCMLLSACCVFIIGAVGNDIGSMTVFPALTVLISLAAAILSFAVPSKKA